MAGAQNGALRHDFLRRRGAKCSSQPLSTLSEIVLGFRNRLSTGRYNALVSSDSNENTYPLDSRGLGSARDGLSDTDLRALFECHRPEILRYALRCAGRREVAEELTSEAFLRMVQNRHAIDAGRAAAWLTTTVKHLAADYWRRQMLERKHAVSLAPRVPEPAINWPKLLQSASLKAEHRACLILRYVHGMERKEIVSHTGLTDHQVKSCLQYGLTLLRKAMGSFGESRE